MPTAHDLGKGLKKSPMCIVGLTYLLPCPPFPYTNAVIAYWTLNTKGKHKKITLAWLPE